MKYLIQLLGGWNVPSSVYKFIGVDGSMGLQKGEHYRVEMQHLTAWIEARDDEDWAPGTHCPYGSLKAFKNNWIKV